MGREGIITVSAFVDWNSQIHISGDQSQLDPLITAKLVLEKTSERIARCLNGMDSSFRYRVSMRLYHGWHKGFEPTANRRAVTSVLAGLNFSDLSPLRNVAFEDNVGYGDCLLYALPRRLHARLGVHLPNTLRMQHDEMCEKMVDTAMAADIVQSAALDPEDWIVVVAEDDDLIPPIFTAEALLSRASSRIALLHNRKRSEKFLKLDDISVRFK
jgi:hypothetical protein